MKETFSSVSPKGQITLPAEIRRALGIKPKDKVAISLQDGEVRVTPARYTLESVGASVQPPTRTEDFERISREAKEEQVLRNAAKLHDRS
jgi:AbrB family looped-hinge helix DNA binding protein